MPNQEHLARGKVTEVRPGSVVFVPSNTNYKLHLETAGAYVGPVNELISATVRAKARKVYTVPSGGGFISPIFGTPRTIQGRAVQVHDGSVVIKAGCPIVVELPREESGVDLTEGPISVGSMVNAVAFPGVKFESASVKIVKK